MNNNKKIKIKKVFRYPLTIICSFFVLIMMIIYAAKADTEFSDVENRYLALKPSISVKGLRDGSFMKDFETYTKEQVPFRNTLVKAKAVCEMALLKQENDSIIKGRGGHLFEKLYSINPQLKKNEQIISMFLSKEERIINTAIIPNSFEILSDLLPAGALSLYVSEKTVIDEFYEGLSSLENVNTIDVYSTLEANKDESLYYRTDHHWTTKGAYLCYLTLCEELRLEPVDLQMLNKNEVSDFYGTYYAKYKGPFVTPDTIEYYDIPVTDYVAGDVHHRDLYDLSKTQQYDKYAMFMYGNEGISIVKSDNAKAGDKELILFKDSYANCLIPFLTYNYDTIYVIDLRYYGDSVSTLLETHENADVLLMYNFMHFNEDNHFYRLTS